jgi:hypothetical protein
MTWPDAQEREPSFSRMHLVLFLAGAGVFLYLRTFLLPATPFAATDDQSLFFARVVRMVQGQVPYRDFKSFNGWQNVHIHRMDSSTTPLSLSICPSTTLHKQSPD